MARIGALMDAGWRVDRTAATSFFADFSVRCEDPKWVQVHGEQQGSFVSLADGTSLPFWLDLQVGCRKCAPCLLRRRILWSARAWMETRLHPRTWFVTLTCKPEVHYLHLEHARDRAFKSGVEFSTLSARERFSRQVSVLGEELTLAIKRLRKNSGAALRYMFVFEAHKSGNPHIHGLIHECYAERPVRQKAIYAAWEHLGFPSAKLVPSEEFSAAAGYCCKYLAKDMRTRVRASLRYGSANAAIAQLNRLDEELVSVDANVKNDHPTTVSNLLMGATKAGVEA